MEERTGNIVPLYAAKIEHLTHADMVTVRCTCGHRGAVSVAAIKAKLPPFMPVAAINRVVRCRRCRAKGDELSVDCRAALGYDRP